MDNERQGRGSAVGFHEGELEVQHRAGVAGAAARLARMLDPADLDDGAGAFLATRELVAFTGRDAEGRLWVSPLVGAPGFLEGRGTTLVVGAGFGPDDPLAALPAGQPVGLVAIDLATRRRLRVNGSLESVADVELRVAVDQAYGNCPRYIQQRRVELEPGGPFEPPVVAAEPDDGLRPDDVALVRQADTCFLGTVHPTRGADASHRGGPPGFVRIDDGRLWWPDYDGNNLFNSFGNLAVDDTAALVFIDFTTGATLHLTGFAAVVWGEPGAPGDDDHTGRRVQFTPTSVRRSSTPIRAVGVAPSPHNPTLT